MEVKLKEQQQPPCGYPYCGHQTTRQSKYCNYHDVQLLKAYDLFNSMSHNKMPGENDKRDLLNDYLATAGVLALEIGKHLIEIGHPEKLKIIGPVAVLHLSLKAMKTGKSPIRKSVLAECCM